MIFYVMLGSFLCCLCLCVRLYRIYSDYDGRRETFINKYKIQPCQPAWEEFRAYVWNNVLVVMVTFVIFIFSLFKYLS